MRVLLVHPSPLMYAEIYLRLEPLGLEVAAAAVRRAGHDVRLIDLQIFSHKDYLRELQAFQPDAVGFSVNYFANIPEVIELAAQAKRHLPSRFVFAGGHSASFVPREILSQAGGAVDCVVCGEGQDGPSQDRERSPRGAKSKPGREQVHGLSGLIAVARIVSVGRGFLQPHSYPPSVLGGCPRIEDLLQKRRRSRFRWRVGCVDRFPNPRGAADPARRANRCVDPAPGQRRRVSGGPPGCPERGGCLAGAGPRERGGAGRRP